jgi:hypothetical protein
MNPWLKRITITVVVLELVYVVLGNLALRLPMTQTLLNKIRPDKFEVTWDEAWTWYPFRVHARGVFANGQSRRQQWQLELPEGSASISLLPLLLKRVNLHDIRGRDVVYFQRPRLRPDNDYADRREFFPPISNRELNDAEPLPTGKRPWTVSVSDARVSGTHTVWLYQVSGVIEGDLRCDFKYRTRGGPFSLDNGKADVVIDRIVIQGDADALKGFAVNGAIGFAEFVPRQHKGVAALPYLTLDANVSGDVDSLAFLNLYLRHFEGMHLEGRGHVEGRLNFARGTLLAGTRLDVDAPELSLELLDHRASGSGTVQLDVRTEAPDTLAVSVQFRELIAQRIGEVRPLFAGEGLLVGVRGDTNLFPPGGEPPHASYLAVTIPAVTVPDLAVYQHYLPDKLGLRFHGGEGVLHGKGILDRVSLHADLKLDADDADVGIKDYRFKADVDIALLTETPADGSEGIDVGGSYLRLSNARLANGQKGESDTWQTLLAVEEGLLKFHLREAIAESGLLWGVREQNTRQLLEHTDGELVLTGSVSNLGWLNQLLKNEYRTEITGSGDLKATLRLQDGWLAAGTQLELLPKDLAVKVLDYLAAGEGSVLLRLDKGGRQPDATVDVLLKNAFLKRRQEDKAVIDHVEMQLQAAARDLGFDGPGKDLALHLRIPMAIVRDMSVYNLYLPENSPLRLLGGQADLAADIRLEPQAARGNVTLKTSKLRSRLDEQELSADVTVHINVAGGIPKNMDFDISGSTLVLDNVKVMGNTKTLQESDWNARVSFTRANTVWKKPVHLQAEADIEMKDSTPIVAMLSNQRNKYGWIEKLLTVGSITGEASMEMQQNRIVFPYAFAGSDEIDVGAKGIITEQTRDGVIFARYRKLKGLLKIRDGERNFDVLMPQQKFDTYSPESVTR